MKSTILLVMHVCCIISVSAQQFDGPRSPHTLSNMDLAGYTQQWKNVSNAAISDNNYATFDDLAAVGDHTDYIVASDFGFNIPVATNITGISVEIEWSDINQQTADYSVRLVNKGGLTGDDKAHGSLLPRLDAYTTYGSDNDLWGDSWIAKNINDMEFGVAIAVQRRLGDPAVTAGQINTIRITVYYSYIILPVSLSSFTAKKEGTNVRLNWKTNLESHMDHYEIERSSNGANFISIGSVASQNTPSGDYSYLDNNPLKGVSYYRLNMKGTAGDHKYSQVVAISFAKNNTAFLYPSPWESGSTLNISNTTGEKLTIYFMNAGGQTLSTAVTETGIVPTETLVNRKGLLYYKVFDKAKNQVGSGSLLIQ